MAAAAALGSSCTTSLSAHLISSAKAPDIDVIDCTMNAMSSVPLNNHSNVYSDKDKVNNKSEKLLLHRNGGGKNNDIEANFSAGSGTFGDGKVILELARSKDGEKSRWISVPRKIFRAPSATSSTVTPTLATSIAYSKNESLTSLSFSDDNSSIQSSPWQRDHCWKQLSPRSGISKAMSLYYRRPRAASLSKIAVFLARKKRRKPCDKNLCPIPIFEQLSSIVLKTPGNFCSLNTNDIQNTNLNSIVLKTSEKLPLSNKNDIKEINRDNETENDMKNNCSVDIGAALINEVDGCSSSSTATLTGNDFSDNRMEEGPTSLAPSFLLSSCHKENKATVNKESKDVDIDVTVEDIKSNILEKVKTTENENIVSTTTRDEGSEPELNGSSNDVPVLNSKVDKVDPNDQGFCVKLNEDQRLKAPKQRVKLNIIVQKLIDRVPERLAQLSRLSQSVGSSNSIQGHSNLISQKVPQQCTSSSTRLVEYPQQHVSPRKRILREFEKVSLEDNCNVAGGKRSRAKSNASSSSASSYRSMESPNNNRSVVNTTSKISSSGNHTISENNVHRPSPSTYAKSSTTSTLMTTAPTRLYSSYSINSLLGGSGCSSSKAPTLATTNVGTSKRSKDITANPMGYHPKQHQSSSQQHYSDPSYLRAMLATPKSPEQCSGVKSPSIPVPKIRSPPYVSPLRDSQALSEVGTFNNKTRYGSDHPLNLDSSSPMHSQNQSYFLPYTSLSKYVSTISNSSNTTTNALNNSGCTADQHSSRFPSAFNRTSSPASVTNSSNQPASTSIGNSRENSPSNSRNMTDSPRDTVPRTVPKKTASIRRQFASPTTAVVNSSSASSVDRPFEDTYSSQDRITPVSGPNICGGGPHQLHRGSSRGNIVPSPLQHYYMYPSTTPNEASSPVQQSSSLSPGIVLPVVSGGTHSSVSTAAQYIPSIMPSAYMNPYFALAALRQPQLWSHYGSASLPVHMPSITNSPSLRLSPSSFHSFAYNGVNAAMAAVMQHQQQQILASSALMHGHSLSRTPVMVAPHNTINGSSGSQDSEAILTEQTTDLAADEIPNNATGLRLETGRCSSIKEEHNSDVPLNLSKH
ncbi:unnamed protein product [Ceratitis capitata]|uniref:(Mediterranean fruit fly) hypothetical protein n=1 Tax=Ceratitis capitata TaxID=7213 RepID=A0A811U291_CERCA|nr:unnamed protein product [Ceratitis capitata]